MDWNIFIVCLLFSSLINYFLYGIYSTIQHRQDWIFERRQWMEQNQLLNDYWKERITHYTHNGEYKSGQLTYRMCIRVPSCVQPFRLTRKMDRYKPTGKFSPIRGIVAVEYVGEKQVQCISVSASDGLYVTDDFIVTHNTTTIGMGACWMALEVHPDFKFLNVAPTALQAQWMYEYIIKMASGTPFERLIWSSPANARRLW